MNMPVAANLFIHMINKRFTYIIVSLLSLSLVYCNDDRGGNIVSPDQPSEQPKIGEVVGPASQFAKQVTGMFFINEDQFMNLLSLEEVESVLIEKEELQQYAFTDIKMLLDSRIDTQRVAVQQVFPLDSGYSVFYGNKQETKSIRFAVLDMNTLVDATNQYEEIKSSTEPPLQVMESPIGHASAEIDANIAGLGSNIVFIKGDKLITLHTIMPEGELPLTGLEGLRQLARIIEQKLDK